ncbi:hypothetical protein Hanom_Chr07g00652481 [Helianthus anomalus]
MLRSKFWDLTHRNVRLWFNVFTFRSKFCELTRRNVRVLVNVFTSSFFSPFDRCNITWGFSINLVITKEFFALQRVVILVLLKTQLISKKTFLCLQVNMLNFEVLNSNS